MTQRDWETGGITVRTTSEIALSIGAPRSMKMGTIGSPLPDDAGTSDALCQLPSWKALIHSQCSLWEKREANLLKLHRVQTFSAASSIMLNSAAPQDWILTRFQPVKACRGRDLAPTLKQSLLE